MAAFGISGLGRAPRRYDPVGRTGFETHAEKQAVDRARARKLRRQAQVNPRHADTLLALADGIDPEITTTPLTFASAVYARRLRRCLIGWLWRLARRARRRARRCPGYAGPATVHIVREGWSVPLGALANWDPVTKLAAVRTDLYRRDKRGRGGAARADGWLFLGIHGSYDAATGTFQMHLHGAAAGDMVGVVDGLRRLRKYQPAKVGDGRDAARNPVVIKRKLRNLPYALGYALQSWWNGRDTYVAEDGLRSPYGGQRRGMPRDAECEYLLFLDRYCIEDLTLLIHLTATKQGLVETAKRPSAGKARVR